VLAIAANKDDMYENEEVDENEAKNLASELNAIFQKTSAKESHGIEDLFKKIGEKILNPKGGNNIATQDGKNTNNDNNKKDTVKLGGKNGGKQKGKCC
jgi:GTPase SAR1 family protein